MTTIHIFNPPKILSVSSFDLAVDKIGIADFYILVCGVNAKRKAEQIKEDYRLRETSVDIVYQEIGDSGSWFVHGMNSCGPPFLTGTVHSKMLGQP